MSESSAARNAILLLIYNGTGWANVADNAGTAPLGNLYVAFHTGDPGAAGTQETNECAYTGYGRVAVARSSGGFTVTGNSVSPVADVAFPEATAGTETITHFSVGFLSTGGGAIIDYGTVTPNIPVTAGVIPRLRNSTTITRT